MKIAEILQALPAKISAGALAPVAADLRTIFFGEEALKFPDLQKIAKLVEGAPADLRAHAKPVRIAILGGYTTQPIRAAIQGILLAEGFWAEIYEAEFNTYKMEVVDASSGLYKFKPEFVLFALGSCNLPFLDRLGPGEKPAEAFLTELRGLWDLVKSRTGATILQHNFEFLDENSLGRLEAQYGWSSRGQIQELNAGLDSGARVIDVAGLADQIGSYRWLEPRWYHFGKYGFNPEFTADYARLFAGTFRALQGKAKKCLVTDLDNTLWGGVIGDEGVHGIRLGQGSPEGEAFLAFGRYLKRLKNRGVLLAVSSKNDPAVAREVFETHAEVPLKMNDFAAFHCSWDTKGAAMANIAKELNIGIDSLVFVDDNPAECAQVRAALPEVTVVELGADPAQYVRRLDKLRLFDQLELTKEDLERSDSYVAIRQIEGLKNSFSNPGDFLRDLAMASETRAISEAEIGRVEQLFGKTNQFNLTGKKFSADELRAISSDSTKICLASWLKDRFTNYGLISALVASSRGDALEIDNWVMSCRVFSRTQEEFIFNTLVAQARGLGVQKIRGRFLSTPKNSYARDLYSRFGFTEKDGAWELSLASAKPLLTYVGGA